MTEPSEEERLRAIELQLQLGADYPPWVIEFLHKEGQLDAFIAYRQGQRGYRLFYDPCSWVRSFLGSQPDYWELLTSFEVLLAQHPEDKGPWGRLPKTTMLF